MNLGDGRSMATSKAFTPSVCREVLATIDYSNYIIVYGVAKCAFLSHLQHGLKELPTVATSLPGLVDVEIKHTHRLYLAALTREILTTHTHTERER